MAKARPVVIGLLGGVASGKSTVARLLAERGAVVLDADAMVGEVLASPELIGALVERFGEGVRAGRGVDREVLSKLVFGHPDHLHWLQERVHPHVRRRLREALSSHLERGAAAAVVLDVPLLIEKSALKKHCDVLIFVDCPADIRRRRVEEHRSWVPGELSRREQHQLPPEEKRKLADRVLVNRDDLGALRCQIDQWLASCGGFDGLPRRAPTPGHPDEQANDTLS